MMKPRVFSWKYLLLVAPLFGLAHCGGGGDDSNNSTEFVGAAQLDVSTSPGRIDTGDRTRTSIAIQDVHKDGIIVKILHPGALRYVENSTLVTVGAARTRVAPAFNGPADTTPESPIFLVFFLSKQTFKSNPGVLSIELEGVHTLADGEIGVDADVNDPLIDDSTEFDVRNPKFDPEVSTGVSVGK